MPMNPWKTLSSSPIYGNKWFAVREDRVIRPDGHIGSYSVVSATRLATGIVPLWPDGTVTLVGQYRYPLDEYCWEIPWGWPRHRPARDRQARAERRSGDRGRHLDLSGAGYHTSNCFTDEICHLFLVRDLTQGVAKPDPEEVLDTRRVPFEEAVRMAYDGRITDSISIAGLFRASVHLTRQHGA